MTPEHEISFSHHDSSEARRNMRKNIERGMSAKEFDRFQMSDFMLGALVLIAALISLTDFSFSFGNLANFTAITIFLYIITMFVYRNRYSKGMSRGRKDAEYKEIRTKYVDKRNNIYSDNLAGKVPEFCTYYKKKELREYRESLLCDIEMEYSEYAEKYLRKSIFDILRLKVSFAVKKTLIKCNKAKAIRLYPGMILNENGEYDRHKLIGKSGRQRERSDKKKDAISRAAYVIFGSLVAVDVIFNFSPTVIAQWIVRMLPIVIAIMSGDDGGYCNVTVTEIRFKGEQINVIELFNEYAIEKRYIEKQSTEEEAIPANDA